MAHNWRLLPYHVGSSTWHFALSDALVRHAPVATVWWHSTQQPTLILGAGQSWSSVDLAACRQARIRLVKRSAGGTAVYAARGVLGLDVALPVDDPLAGPDVVEAYRWLGEVWTDAVRSLGAPARLVTLAEAQQASRRSQPLDDVVRMACFGALSPYEVAVGHRKLVGLAQVRRRRNVLLQAGVHLSFDAAGLAALLATPDRAQLCSALQEAVVGLDAVTPARSDEEDVIAAVHRSLARLRSVALADGAWTETELEHAREVEPSITYL